MFTALAVGDNKAILDLNYPIEELGGCVSQEECGIYCSKEENRDKCLNFAKENNLIPEEEIDRIKKDIEKFEEKLEEFGPGGCMTPKECDAYCHVLDNLDECLEYGVKHGHTSQEEADKIREDAERGGPGGCKSDKECDNYCKNPDNADECFKFVIDEGKITQEEADFLIERMKTERKIRDKDEIKINEEKVLEILETGSGPGGCKTMEECDEYCSGFDHGPECLEFAIQNGLISEGEDMEHVERMSKIKSGPGGCLNQEECDEFCEKEENQKECMDFMIKNKMMSEEEIKMMEKEMMIIKKLNKPMGPKGCSTSEECRAYCEDPNHTEECINFASQDGNMFDKNMVDKMMGETQEAKDKIRHMEGEKRNLFDFNKENGENYREYENNYIRKPDEHFIPEVKSKNDYEYRREDFIDDHKWDLPKECEEVGAMSPEACDKHMRDMMEVGPGCGDCSTVCLPNAETDCIDNRCICKEVFMPESDNIDFSQEMPEIKYPPVESYIEESVEQTQEIFIPESDNKDFYIEGSEHFIEDNIENDLQEEFNNTSYGYKKFIGAIIYSLMPLIK